MCCTRALDEFELILVECALKIMTLIQDEHVRSRPMLRTGVRSQGVLPSQARREPLGPASCSDKERNCRSRCLFFFFALEIVGNLPQNEFTIYSEVVLNLTSHSDDFKLRCLCFPYSKCGGWVHGSVNASTNSVSRVGSLAFPSCGNTGLPFSTVPYPS